MKTEAIFELSNEEYHRGEAYSKYISSTQLKWYLKSPKYARLCMTDPAFIPEQTEAMRNGSLFHDAMEFVVNGGALVDFVSKLAVFNPPVNEKTGLPYASTTKAHQEAYNAWKESVSSSGKTMASQADVEFVQDMVVAATSNKIVRKLIELGKPDSARMKGPEVSVTAQLETPAGNDLLVKCRADLLTARKCVDWKSSSLDSFTPESVGKAIYDFGYDVSAAFYQYVLYKHTGSFYQFIWCFISTKEPHEVCVCDANRIAFSSIEDLDMFENDKDRVCVFNPGVMRMRALLDLHARCIDENFWPGSEVFTEPDDSGLRIMSPELPAWAARQEIKAYF